MDKIKPTENKEEIIDIYHCEIIDMNDNDEESPEVRPMSTVHKNWKKYFMAMAVLLAAIAIVNIALGSLFPQSDLFSKKKWIPFNKLK